MGLEKVNPEVINILPQKMKQKNTTVSETEHFTDEEEARIRANWEDSQRQKNKWGLNPKCEFTDEEWTRYKESEAKRREAINAERLKLYRASCGLSDHEWDMTSEPFSINNGNRKAHAAIQEFIEKQDTNILLCGKAGIGKSRLASYAVASCVKKFILSRYWTTTMFLITLRSKAYGKDSDEIEVLKEMMNTDVLVLDDFGATKITDWSLMMMDTIIDAWYRSGEGGLIVTSNLPLARIGTEVSDRIASRLAEMCRVFNMDGKDWRVGKGRFE